MFVDTSKPTVSKYIPFLPSDRHSWYYMKYGIEIIHTGNLGERGRSSGPKEEEKKEGCCITEEQLQMCRLKITGKF